MPREQYYNTRDQVAGYLRDALALVEELDPPADLRALAFEKAVALLAAKAILQEQAPVPVAFPLEGLRG